MRGNGAGEAQGFPTTAWSLVVNLSSGEDQRRDAIGRLFSQYYPAILAHLRRTWRRKTIEQIEDLASAFFERILEKDIFKDLDTSKSRFRTFLKVLLDRFARDQHDADTSVKRGGAVRHHSFSGKAVDLDKLLADHEALSPGDILDEVVREDLLARAKERVRAWAEASGRGVQYEAFRLYALEPAEGESYQGVARRLSIKESDVRNYIHGMRKRLEQELKELIKPGVLDPVDGVEAEFQELFRSA